MNWEWCEYCQSDVKAIPIGFNGEIVCFWKCPTCDNQYEIFYSSNTNRESKK